MSHVCHMVLLRFKPGTSPTRIADLFAALGRLKGKLPGIVQFAGGPYSSPEGLNQGFTHGFLMRFADVTARNTYLSHPDHERVKQEFLPLVENVIAFDFEE